MTLSVLEVYAAPLGPDYPLGGGTYLNDVYLVWTMHSMTTLNRIYNLRKRTARRLLIGVVVLSVLSGSTPAFGAHGAIAGKDAVFATKVKESVDKSIEVLVGSSFEVDSTGRAFAENYLQDAEVIDMLVGTSKQYCKQLNAASKKGPRAVRAKAVQIGKRRGTQDYELIAALIDEAAARGLPEDYLFSIATVIGMISAAHIIHGLEVYCPKYAKYHKPMISGYTVGIRAGAAS